MQKRFKLTNWLIKKDFFKNYVAVGKVHNNPKFNEGKSITTSEIVSFETEDECLVIHTLNSTYELPNNSYIGNGEDVEKMKNYFYEQYKKALKVSEKLLSSGDSLIFNKTMVYCSDKEGMVRMTASREDEKIVFEYTDENFRLLCNTSGFSDSHWLQSCKSEKNMLYVLDQYSISKFSYKSLINKENPFDAISEWWEGELF